jgi:branched-subunit amino acid transport protein
MPLIKGGSMSAHSESFWLPVILFGVGTFLLRFIFIWAFGRGEIRSEIKRALRFVPASVLAALVAPNVILIQGTSSFSISNERLWAGVIAAAIAWRTKNMFLTISSGMASLWVLFFFKGSF